MMMSTAIKVWQYCCMFTCKKERRLMSYKARQEVLEQHSSTKRKQAMSPSIGRGESLIWAPVGRYPRGVSRRGDMWLVSSLWKSVVLTLPVLLCKASTSLWQNWHSCKHFYHEQHSACIISSLFQILTFIFNRTGATIWENNYFFYTRFSLFPFCVEAILCFSWSIWSHSI